MTYRTKIRRLVLAGLAGGVLLCLVLIAAAVAIRTTGGLASLSRTGGGRQGGAPSRFGFWEKVDILLLPDARGLPSQGGPAPGRREPRSRSPGAGPDPYRVTADVDQRELAEALIRQGVPEARRSSLLADYRRLRAAWLSLDEKAAADRAAAPGLPFFSGSASPSAAAPEPAGEPAVPAGLPAEFTAYLEGALAYRAGRDHAATAAWEKLLALPESERHYRSTWAAFMLGRGALRAGDLDPAVRRFQQTRDLAASGFADSLHLAMTSLGWEARAEIARRNFDRAEILYTEQARAGDPTALDSLRILWRERLIASFH
ncbi:MAG TPA: hypothetical protein VHR45_16555 [Thermoanaerobaculia bacterium]|nr:hypothetical protein [Thermoanaerobaculia bacterium]